MTTIKERIGRKPRAQRPPSGDDLTGLRNTLGQTVGFRVDVRSLPADEQWELVRLARTMNEGSRPGERRVPSPGTLPDKERERFEQLAAKAGGKPGNVFEEEREMQKLRAEAARLAAIARRPDRRPCLEEEGSVTLDRQTVFEYPNRAAPVLLVEHLGLLVWLLGLFENAELPHVMGGHFEGEGDDLVLVLDSQVFSASAFGWGGEPRWRLSVDHLCANGYFEVEKLGKHWRVRLGSRARRMRKGASK